MRKLAAILFIDYRAWFEAALTAALVGGFLIATGGSDFDSTLDDQTRSDLYSSLAGTCAALLGFVLAALAILVALPSSDRLEALKKHPKWPRVPSSYFRASRALLAALILCTLGIPLDSDTDPWQLWEMLTVVALVLAVVRVAAAVVALDQILAVARAGVQTRKLDDPGP